MSEAKHTPGPLYVGAQNDALYVVAGDKPAPNNDYPRHDANRTVIAKVYEQKYANILAAAPELLAALKHTLRAFEMLYAEAFAEKRDFMRMIDIANSVVSSGAEINPGKVIAKAEGRNA